MSTIDRYSVTRQRVNCGPTQTIYTETREAAQHAFNLAVADNDQWVTLWNETQDYEEQRHLAPRTHTVYGDEGRKVVTL